MQPRTEQQPEVKAVGVQVDQSEYKASQRRYKRLANLRLRNFDTIVLSGHGCFVKIRDDALVVEYQRPGEQGNDRLLRLNRGTHKIKQIILLAHSGYISFSAIEWATQQNVVIIMLTYDGELLQVLTPHRQPRSAKLCYLQFKAGESDLCIEIARELVRRKTLAQIEVLKALSERRSGEAVPLDSGKRILVDTSQGRVSASSACQFLEDGLVELSLRRTIGTIQSVEGRLASYYWQSFVGLPILWDRKSSKSIPAHWLFVTERVSGMSGYLNAHRANNPFHACLNFCYSLLQADVLRAIHVANLEPNIAFLHLNSEQHHSLVFDLMEPFRPIVDAMVLAFFQKITFSKSDFYQEITGEVRMSEMLRRHILASCRVNPVEIDQVVRWLRSTLEGGPV